MDFIHAEQIEATITMKELIETIESYYKEGKKKNALTPERLFINDGDNSALLMPSFFENYYAAKTIGIAPGNAKIGRASCRERVEVAEVNGGSKKKSKRQ